MTGGRVVGIIRKKNRTVLVVDDGPKEMAICVKEVCIESQKPYLTFLQDRVRWNQGKCYVTPAGRQNFEAMLPIIRLNRK